MVSDSSAARVVSSGTFGRGHGLGRIDIPHPTRDRERKDGPAAAPANEPPAPPGTE